ncbi:protein-disulfide reductase DsbD [Noviherbaspirillum cavernae]|uniref:Thiol:disulfide interchange protein DsbD n=1 Tax=Noviherbaspirillum cavernae TaxID=2320862 RepID=A0A418X6L7_9BURK|nr:protein-disulfide reductase DsbD [Noviherbaspirillum cavernae]RJG08127.1 protein-disulfide reductase DsbD [Noviherbaspirillum cavernae]
MAALLLAVLLCTLAWPAHAGDDDYLDPEAAFKFSAKMADARNIEITYAIADGYYMYRERFAFKAEGARLGEPVIPPGKVKFDETFQKDVETYRKAITITLPVEASGPFTLTATSQGCADKGLCYAPMDAQIKLSPNGGGLLAAITSARDAVNPSAPNAMDSAPPAPNGSATRAIAPADSEMGRIEASLKSGKLLAIVPLFLLLGLGLSFTPCVLPMVPILSMLIVGEGARVSRARGFSLSATYALGMALVYTALGIAAGLAGEGLSASLQNPWVLGVFALLMVAFSFSMFGMYQLQLPSSLQTKLAALSEKQSSGKLFGVFAMGAISALIVGPCVAAPLAGALVYISQTRDVVIGGSALFAMAAGMSIPLLLVGISAGSLLPRAGVWMDAVKRFFGVLILALALWIVAPVIPASVQMLGWAALGIGYGAYLLWSKQTSWMPKALSLMFAAFGLVQLIGVTTGGRDALAPLAHLTGAAQHADFKRVKSIAELDAAIAQARGKTVMLDFYADWCVSCKEMEKLTFTDARVQAQFANMVLLQVDVTANSADDKTLLKRFGLFGPPGIIFFDKQGREIQGGRVIGYQNTERFLQSLSLASSF